METALLEIRNQQKASWNKFSPGWKKWDDLVMDFLRPQGDELIGNLNLKNNYQVLDVAAGTGEPGLTIASMVPKGRVIITDLAEEMLTIAHENADLRGIRNMETLTVDASELPFDDDAFDAISCRLGFRYFPDMSLAGNEMVRVLKPGHRIATTVWSGPEGNPWITIMMNAIDTVMQIPPTSNGSPGMFRCAQPGLMASILSDAGLKDLVTREIKVKLRCGTAEAYWGWMTDVVAPVVAALGSATKEEIVEIKQLVFGSLAKRYRDGKIVIEGTAKVIAGTK
ncbi:MAG TPA: class I SAM-dependent methyltransferase [Chryseolinea sp.]|nr:class I SAM-dependent methyltransferase [Chryseolinea sp.]